LDELQQKTREQAETLEEQAATNHILEIISQSPTDVQPVLDAIAESAARLCQAGDANVRLIEGDSLRLYSHHGITPNRADELPVDSSSVPGRAVLERQTISVVTS